MANWFQIVQVTVSVIEIYCERIRDLLEPGNDNLQVQQERLRGITVAHTTEVPVSSEAELVKVMQKGLANRAVASTAMNAGKACLTHQQFEDMQSPQQTCHCSAFMLSVYCDMLCMYSRHSSNASRVRTFKSYSAVSSILGHVCQCHAMHAVHRRCFVATAALPCQHS